MQACCPAWRCRTVTQHLNRNCMQELPCLEVLDLQSNLMETMDGISTLVSLRLLNLSGNRIRHLSDIENLSSLAELNLGRNFIASLMPPEEAAAAEVCECPLLCGMSAGCVVLLCAICTQ